MPDRTSRSGPFPGLRFGYGAAGNVSMGRSLAGAIQYLLGLPELLARLRVSLAVEQPDLVISDFEPALPRAARQMGIPHVSLNHQHFLLTYDLRSLPAWLRLHTLYMGCVVRAYDSPAVARVVSSFYFPPLRTGCKNVTQTGVLLRPSVLEAERSRQSHLVAYWRRQAPAGALDALADLQPRSPHLRAGPTATPRSTAISGRRRGTLRRRSRLLRGADLHGRQPAGGRGDLSAKAGAGRSGAG